MAAYTQSDRQRIRQWLGYSGVVYQNLEAAISATQAVADGGSLQDSTTQTAVQGWLTQLDAVLVAIQGLRTQAQVLRAEEATLDAYRGIATLEKEGRLYVGFLADALCCKPARDVFSRVSLTTNPSNPYGVMNQ